MLSFGLDTGADGAGLLLHEGRAVAAAAWKTHQVQGVKKYALTLVNSRKNPPQVMRGLETPWAIGMALRQWLGPMAMLYGGGRISLGCEGAYVGRNPRTAIILSRFSGSLVGPIEPMSIDHKSKWANPDEWRKELFREKWWKRTAEESGCVASKAVAERTGRKFMKKREAAKLQAAITMPKLIEGLAELADKTGGREHVMDAAGVAAWMASIGKGK